MIALGRTENGLTIAVLETHELNILHAVIPMLKTAPEATETFSVPRGIRGKSAPVEIICGRRSDSPAPQPRAKKSKPPRAQRSQVSTPGSSQPELAIEKMRRTMVAANRPFSAKELSRVLHIKAPTISGVFFHNPSVFAKRSHGVYALADARVPTPTPEKRSQAKQTRLALIRSASARVYHEPDPIDRAAAQATQIRSEEGMG